MVLFIITGGVGLLFFVTSLLFDDHDVHGHDHDVGDDVGSHDGDHESAGPSVLSVFTVSWFLIGFGGAGAFARAYGISMPASTFSGILTGAGCWALAFAVMSLLYKQQADSTVTPRRLLDATGVVIMLVPAQGVGKIQCSVAGGLHDFLARSAKDEELPEGTLVRITGDVGGVYFVEKMN